MFVCPAFSKQSQMRLLSPLPAVLAGEDRYCSNSASANATAVQSANLTNPITVKRALSWTCGSLLAKLCYALTRIQSREVLSWERGTLWSDRNQGKTVQWLWVWFLMKLEGFSICYYPQIIMQLIDSPHQSTLLYRPLCIWEFVYVCVIVYDLMGNFQDQFENVRQQASEISERNRIQNTVITYGHHSLARSRAPPQKLALPVVDQQLLHSTVIRRDLTCEQTLAVRPQQQDSEQYVQQQRLEQLDLTFYQHLALLDYEFRPIPQQYHREFMNLQTVEQQDLHGIKYVGEWKDGLLHGNGVLLSNTSKYIGQFRNGLKHFHGREIFRREVYEGEFEAGRRRGVGVRYIESATEVGVFDGNLIFGTVKYSNGNEYKGTLRNNKYHGGGVDFSSPAVALSEEFNSMFSDQYMKDSARRYLVEHPDDGKGNVFYDAEANTWYQKCSFHHGTLTYAKVMYSNGNVYQGQLQKGRKHGRGRFQWKDGSVYEGEYQCDQKHGRGTLTTRGKVYREREFVHGQMKDQMESVLYDEQSEMPADWQ